MNQSSTDRIVKQIELNAPVARVWHALTDYKEFGAWFRVNLESPFVVGETTRGQVTNPGCDHMVMEFVVEQMQPERLFSYRWHPCYEDDSEPSTLVEFTLEPAAEGTLLRITESGFDALSQVKRDEVWRRNDGGWTGQVENITAHVTGNP
jgi:uncharacterized protein YndB with AHSA1/START domain